MMSLPVWRSGPMFLLGEGSLCLSSHVPSGGGLCQGGSLSGGSLSRVSIQGEGLCPGGEVLSGRGVLSQGRHSNRNPIVR